MRILYLFSLSFIFTLLALPIQGQTHQGLNPGHSILGGGPTVVGDTICEGDSAVIYVVPEPNKSYVWYDAMSGGNVVGMGDSLFPGALSTTTTFYLEPQNGSAYSVGPFDNTIAGGSNYTYDPDGLVFTVLSTCTIDTVYVYPNGPGNVVINIENSAQTNLHTVTVPVTTTGKTPIPINYTIAPGTGYRMHNVGTTTGGVFRNTGGAAYPYNSPVLNITGAINSSTTFYYKFYDWQVSVNPAPDPRVAVTVVVNPNPAVNAGNDLAYCGSGAPCVTINAAVSGGTGPYDHIWTPANGLNGTTALNPCAAPAGTTTYNLVSTDLSTGCKGTDSITVNVAAAYAAGLTDTSFCSGDLVQTCAVSLPGYSYAWSNGDTLVCTSFNSSGTYALQVTDTLGCTFNDTTVLTENFVPGSALSIDSSGCPVLVFSDISTGGPSSWLWDFGTGDTAQSQNPSYTYPMNGSYNVSLVTANGCGSDTLSVPVTISCIIARDEAFAAAFRIYPNPSQGQLRLESLQPLSEGMRLEVRAADGRLVHTRLLSGTELLSGLALDLAGEAAGMYTLSLRGEEVRYHTKVLLVH